MPFRSYLEYFGFEVAGLQGMDAKVENGLIPEEAPFEMARKLVEKHPEIDTIYLPSPHWAVIGSIERMEQELGVTVVSAMQSIVWEGLRLAGIDDPIPGYGRLLREF
jgi:maleate isomerase